MALRIYRLRLLGCIMQFSTHTLHGLVAQENRTKHERNGTSWLHRMLDVMDWMRTVHDRTRDTPNPKDDGTRREQRILCYTSAWRRMMSAAMRAEATAQASAALARKTSDSVFETARTAGLRLLSYCACGIPIKLPLLRDYGGKAYAHITASWAEYQESCGRDTFA
eukprot:9072192-Pyramimonas_sp.AAC.1